MEVTADPFDDTLESPDVEEKGSDVTVKDIGTHILIFTLGSFPLIAIVLYFLFDFMFLPALMPCHVL